MDSNPQPPPTPQPPSAAASPPSSLPAAPAEEAMINVTPSAAKPAPTSANASKELTPPEPLTISPKMRALLGSSPYRDISSQVDAEALLAILGSELKAGTFMQIKLADDLANLIVSQRHMRRAVQTAIIMARPDAAREALCRGWTHFRLRSRSAPRSDGQVETAYGLFMNEGGDAVANLTDEQAITQAIAKLAEVGLPEDALTDLARIIALPTIEPLEKLLATNQAEQEGLLEQLLRLMDRRENRGLGKAA